jgi:hypothetical protein
MKVTCTEAPALRAILILKIPFCQTREECP